MPELLEDPVGRLINLHNSSSARTIIALAGYPGSGKSTIVNKWAEGLDSRLGQGEFLVLGMDGFHLTKAQLAAMDNPDEALARRGAPYTFDPAGLIAKVKALRSASGEADIGWPGFEHGVGDPVENAIVVPASCRLILVEGIYTLMREGLWAGLNELFDEGWFLDVPLETAMDRLYKRHQKAWGMSETEARARADSNDRLNCEFILPGRATADYLLRGNA